MKKATKILLALNIQLEAIKNNDMNRVLAINGYIAKLAASEDTPTDAEKESVDLALSYAISEGQLEKSEVDAMSYEEKVHYVNRHFPKTGVVDEPF